MTQTALITGASTGIGYQLCRQFAGAGYGLILVSRSEGRLQEVADELADRNAVPVRVFPIDLSERSAPGRLYEAVNSANLEVDVLVNCAGFGTSGEFAELDLDTEVDLINLNVIALVQLTQLYLKDMIARRHGRILNVSSLGGFMPGPYMADYFASKAFVLHFTEAVSEEARRHNVSVCALCPGPTETPFFGRAGMHGVRLIEGAFANMMSAEDVAKTAFRGLQRGKTVIVPGLINRMLIFSVRTAPRWLVRKITAFLNTRPSSRARGN